MITRCVVTSRPVVGSSAISSRGWQARAIAINTRWHMPPDSSNGYACQRFSGSAILTVRSNSIASLLSLSPALRAWARSASPICSPTRRIGFSEARGFWKIIAISRPRISRICGSWAATRSMPS